MSTATVRLGDVATFVRGITFKPADILDEVTADAVGCMRTKNVQTQLDETDVWFLPKNFVANKNQVLQEGDLLVSTANSWNLVGKACWVPKLSYECTFGGFISALRATDALIDRRYLYYWFTSAKIQAKLRSFGNKTTNISNLSIKRANDLVIPLPPLAQQKRIAAILDKAAGIKAKREQAIAKLDELAQSTFLEMFGDVVANDKGWQSVTLGSVTSKLGSGATPSGGDASYKAEGIALIRSLNVHDGEFVYKNLAYIDDEQAAKLSNVVVQKNDVLLNITGASVARVCRVPDAVVPARVNQHVMIVRPTEKINPIFLERLLLSAHMKQKLLQVGGAGATREAITKAQATELKVICPPITLQKKFAEIAKWIEKLKAQEIDGLASLQKLTSSLQHQAFTTGFGA